MRLKKKFKLHLNIIKLYIILNFYINLIILNIILNFIFILLKN